MTAGTAPAVPPGADQAVCAVVVRDDGAVLLHRRRDVPIWDLPGGALEAGEEAAAAAARETREETGYEVRVERLVGRFWRPQDPRGGTLVHLFHGVATGGEALAASAEARAVEWFPADRLPRLLFPPAREYVRAALEAGAEAPGAADAAAGAPVRVRTQRMAPWLALAMRVAFLFRR
jgi:ADP-ribose pyrophosphatase YjhB (NUDIX family)